MAALAQADVLQLVKCIRVQLGPSLAVVLLLLRKWEELTRICELSEREADVQRYLLQPAQALSVVEKQYWWVKLLSYDISMQDSNELFCVSNPQVYLLNEEPQRQMGIYNLWEYLQIVSDIGSRPLQLSEHHVLYCFLEAAKKANSLTPQSGTRCHHWVAYHNFVEYEEEKNVHEWILSGTEHVSNSRLLNVLIFEAVDKERMEFQSTDIVTVMDSNAFGLAVELVSKKIDMFAQRGYLFQSFRRIDIERIDEAAESRKKHEEEDQKEEKIEEVTLCALFWNWVKKKPITPQVIQVPAVTVKRAPLSPRKSNITIGWLANELADEKARPLLSPRIIPR